MLSRLVGGACAGWSSLEECNPEKIPPITRVTIWKRTATVLVDSRVVGSVESAGAGRECGPACKCVRVVTSNPLGRL